MQAVLIDPEQEAKAYERSVESVTQIDLAPGLVMLLTPLSS